MDATRRAALALATCAVLAAACTSSRVDPNARISIRGDLQRQDGRPAPGVRLALTTEPDIGEIFGTVVSLGLSCLTDGALPSACDGVRVASTDGDGSFVYDLRGRDTQGSFGNASTLELSAQLPRAGAALDGPGATMRFLVQTEELRLPLRFWEPSVRAASGPRVLRVRWGAVPNDILPAYASLAGLVYDVRFAGAGTASVWRFERTASGRALDARLLEDTTGTMAVVARVRGVRVPDRAGSKIDVILRSARYPYAGVAGAPPSRGKACFAYGRGHRPVAQASCRLTDGEMRAPFEPATGRGGTSRCGRRAPCREAFVDLGSVRRVTLVAIRGCDGTCSVETSRDRRAWRFAGSGSPDGGHVALDLGGEGIPARYVRVSSGGGIGRLSEVSVWDDAVPVASDAGARSILGRGGGGPGAPHDTGGSNGLLLVAAVAIGLAIGALVAVVAMRARRRAA